MQYLYLPIKLPEFFDIELEPRLKFLEHLIAAAIDQECFMKSVYWMSDKYVYLTVKQTVVPQGLDQNRPGWHSDGFLTDDVQYIWFDKFPTEFMIGKYDVTMDDTKSMVEFEKFGDRISRELIDSSQKVFFSFYDHDVPRYFHQPEPFHLYRIDQNHIHRTVPAPQTEVRLFVKLTISKHRYAQEGNSHNYGLNYDWQMYPRKKDRNQPHQK